MMNGNTDVILRVEDLAVSLQSRDSRGSLVRWVSG